MLQIKCSLFVSFFFNVKAIFFSGEASCGYNTAGIIFYFILFFCIKYLNFYFNVQEKPPIGEPFGQRNAAVETEPFPGYWIRIQAGICGFYRKKTNKKTQRA